MAGSSHSMTRVCRISAGVLLSLLSITASIGSAQISVHTNKNSNEGKFEGQEFSRLCYLEGTSDEAFFEWLHNGVVDMSGEGPNLELRIFAVDLEDAGDYSCRATLDDSSVIGPVQAGTLVVLDSRMIVAPSIQYVNHGVEQFSLICSYPDAFTFWSRAESGSPVSGTFTSPSFDDEGQYNCQIFYADSSREIQASIMRTVQLYVFVPVDIVSHPPPHTRVDGNPPHALTVAFNGRMAQNISIIWTRDGIQLPSNQINTTYSPSQLSGTTQVKFSKVSRNAAGVYRVIIRSEMGEGVYPIHDTEEEVHFQLDVIVPPAPPTDLTATEVFATSALFKWTLTHQNADQAADTLVLHLTYENGTLFRNETISGGSSERLVSNLIPGISYNALLVAKNVDGIAEEGPIQFSTLPGHPLLSAVHINRFNATHFTVTLNLAYTGGGAIETILLRLENTNTMFRIPAVRRSNLVWTGDFSITDLSLNPDASLAFTVSALNEHGFDAQGVPRVVVPAYEPPTTPPSDTPEGIDPLVLILICVVVGAVVITTVLLVLVIIALCACRHKSKKNKTYSPNEQSIELGDKQLQEDNAMITQGATTEKSATIELGSVPNVLTPTPSEDNYKKLGHTRTPSNASSKASSNRSHSVSIASCSPNTMLMTKFHNERNMNAYEDSTFGSHSQLQLSQTESESLMKPPMGHSQIRLTNSTSSSPHSSIISMPQYQYRHVSPYEHYHLQQQQHRSNYSQTIEEGPELEYLPQHPQSHQYQNHSLSVSGSEMMDTRPTPESICTCSMTTGGELSPDCVHMQPAAVEYSTKQVSVV